MRRARLVFAFAVLFVCFLLAIGTLKNQANDIKHQTNANASNTRQIATLTAELKKAVQSPTHGHDISLWCNAINAERDYERQYSRATIRQTEADAKLIERAIAHPVAHGLTSAQADFIRLYLSSIVALEREAPQTLTLHPFKLGDLNCAQIVGQAVASQKVKK